MPTTNGSGEPNEAIAEEAEGQEIELNQEAEKSKKAKEADDDEQFSPAELRKRKPTEDTGISEKQKQLDRELEKAKFQTQFISFSSKFNQSRESGLDIEEAIAENNIPVHIANKLRKIAEGKETVDEVRDEQPDISSLVSRETMKVRLREKADDKFSLIVESAKLTKAEAIAFDKETQLLEKKGLDPLESVELASAKLGYSARKEVQEAEERGLSRGLRAIPKIGSSPNVIKEKMTESEEFYINNPPSWLRSKKA